MTPPDEKYSLVRRLSPQSAATYNFSDKEVCLYLFYFVFHGGLNISEKVEIISEGKEKNM